MGISPSIQKDRDDGGKEKIPEPPPTLPDNQDSSDARIVVENEGQHRNKEQMHEPTQNVETINGENGRRLDEARLSTICNALHRLIMLQRKVTTASIEARSKHREASFKRQVVSDSDVRFMDKVQHLIASKKDINFDALSKLHLDCQCARDDLGPIEQEAIDAEQNYEGAVWRLRAAEDKFHEDFQAEFLALEEFDSGSPLSIPYSPYIQSSASESQDGGIFEIEQSQPYIFHGSASSGSNFGAFLPASNRLHTLDEEVFPVNEQLAGINQDKTQGQQYNQYLEEWDNSVYNIYQELPDSPPPLYKLGKSVSVSLEPPKNNITLLLTSFTSTGNRVNRWLAYTLLSSSFEAMKLFDDVKDEFKDDVPSNWAQLVVAFWERPLFEAVDPEHTLTQPKLPHISAEKMEMQGRMLNVPGSNFAMRGNQSSRSNAFESEQKKTKQGTHTQHDILFTEQYFPAPETGETEAETRDESTPGQQGLFALEINLVQAELKDETGPVRQESIEPEISEVQAESQDQIMPEKQNCLEPEIIEVQIEAQDDTTPGKQEAPEPETTELHADTQYQITSEKQISAQPETDEIQVVLFPREISYSQPTRPRTRSTSLGDLEPGKQILPQRSFTDLKNFKANKDKVSPPPPVQSTMFTQSNLSGNSDHTSIGGKHGSLRDIVGNESMISLASIESSMFTRSNYSGNFDHTSIEREHEPP